jgi:hypothetical protein
MLQLKLGGQSAPAATFAERFDAAPKPQESMGSDLAKSVGSGLEQGTATALGLPGDLASLAHSVAPQGVIDAVKAIPGAKFVYNHLPGSQAVLDSASDPLVDPNYQPQTAPGRYSQTLARNAGPGLVSGMGAPSVVLGSLAEQGVTDATGSKLAGAGANLATSIAAPLALARMTRQAMMPLHDAAQVKAAANAGYATPLIRDTAVTPQAAQAVAGDMDAALNAARSRFSPEAAPKVTQAIEGLGDRSAASGVGPPAPVSVEDLHLLRKRLGTIGRETQDFKPTEQAVAAGTAKRVLDNYLDSIPSRDVTRGNPIDAVDALRTANGNWRASSNAKDVGDLIGNAIESNASKNSAMNLGNTLRQTFLPLLKNDAAKLRAKGYGDDVIGAVRQVTQGDFTTNALRRASNMLGGGGGIASTLIGHGIASGAGGAAGYSEGGLPGMIAGTVLGAAPGQLLRVAANRRTLAAAQRVQERLLARAPVNAGIVGRNSAARLANAAAYSQAVGSNGIPNALLQATKVKRIYVGPNRSDDN